MNNIIGFNNITTVTMPPEKILDAAKEHVPEELLIIGWGKEGKLYFAGTHYDVAGNLLLLEAAKRDLMDNFLAEQNG